MPKACGRSQDPGKGGREIQRRRWVAADLRKASKLRIPATAAVLTKNTEVPDLEHDVPQRIPHTLAGLLPEYRHRWRSMLRRRPYSRPRIERTWTREAESSPPLCNAQERSRRGHVQRVTLSRGRSDYAAVHPASALALNKRSESKKRPLPQTVLLLWPPASRNAPNPNPTATPSPRRASVPRTHTS